MSESPYAHLVGHKFPGASYTLPEYVAWLWHDACLVEPDAAVAHPSLAHLVGMQGVGMSIAEMFGLMDATADSGVMYGQADYEFAGTLHPGATYDSDAEIVGVERKEGRRAGVFDTMTFQVRVRERGGSPDPVVTCTHTWVFPRGSEA